MCAWVFYLPGDFNMQPKLRTKSRTCLLRRSPPVDQLDGPTLTLLLVAQSGAGEMGRDCSVTEKRGFVSQTSPPFPGWVFTLDLTGSFRLSRKYLGHSAVGAGAGAYTFQITNTPVY